jgi:hypothetical protein
MEPTNTDFSYLDIVNQPNTDITNTVKSIQKKSPIQNGIKKVEGLKNQDMNVNFIGSLDGRLDSRMQTYDNTTPFSDVYKSIGTGAVAKFETYVPRVDNQERLSQSQSTGDKWANGLLKAGNNLLTTVVGNTVGFVYGLAEGAREGSWNAVFDNSFSNALADYNEKLGYQLPSYVKKDEQDNNFFQNMGTANFWANDVAGALSFTLGTAVSEGIWAFATGGASIAARAGLYGAKVGNITRWGKAALGAEQVALGLAKNKSFVQKGIETMYRTGQISKNTAKLYANTAKVANTFRFLATSSGNEAGIEALHYKREQQENFYDNFERLNGREPSKEEIQTFENNLEDSANAVFATNMAILTPSNMAMFGSIFNIASPFKGAAKAMNKSMFGIGTKTLESGVVEGLKATGKQKGAQYAYAALKPLVTEGLFEEGLQGVTTKTAENWISASYDPKYNNETMAFAEATGKAFSEQYGTKEGWNAIGIGAIVGGISSLTIGKGKFQEVRQFEKDEQYQQEYVAEGLNKFGANDTVAQTILMNRVIMDARVKDAAIRQGKAAEAGNDVEAQLASNHGLLANIQFRDTIGEDLNNFISLAETALETTTDEQWAEQGISDIENHKEQILKGVKDTINSYKDAKGFADAILGDTRILGTDVQTQQMKDALTFSIVSGQYSNKAMDSAVKDMSDIIGEDTLKAKSIQAEIERMGKNMQARVRRTNISIAQAEAEVKSLSTELQRLQVSKDETKGERLQKVQEKLLLVNEEVRNLKQQREELAKEVSQESKRRRGINKSNPEGINLDTEFILGSDLENIDGKLQKIDEIIKSYEGINHQVYYDLMESMKQYNFAKDSFFSYQATVDAIVNGNFKPKFSKAEGLLGRVFNSKEPIDNFTAEFLETTYNNYKKSIENFAVGRIEGDSVSDEDYKTFKEEGTITETILNDIASKVKNKERLTEREQEIYQAKTDEINKATKPNPNKPDLNSQVKNVEVLTEAEAIRQEIEQAFEKDYPLLTTDVDELIRDRPTKEEIEKYKELYEKRANLDLFEQPVFEELQARMSKWFMAQSLPSGEKSIADLVVILSQLETTSEKRDTLDNIDNEVQFLETVADRDSRAQIREDIAQSISGSAVVKKYQGKVFLSHVNAQTIIKSLKLDVNDEVLIAEPKYNSKGVLQKATPSEFASEETIEKFAKVEGTVFSVNGVQFSIGARSTIIFSETLYNQVKEQINLIFIDSKTGSWSSQDLYERLPDGTTRKKDSEFETNTNSELLYDAKTGSNLELFVDMDTQWNKGLSEEFIKEYLKTNGQISKELKDKIEKTLEITLKGQQGNVATLKAASEKGINDNFLLLRKRYADSFIEELEYSASTISKVKDLNSALETLPKKIDLEADVDVKDMYLGSPILQLDENNQPKEQPITQIGTEKVLTQGYISSKEGLVVADKTLKSEEVSNLYVTNLMDKNPDLKIPVVILEKGEYKFAFPITMLKREDDRSGDLEAILTSAKTPVAVVIRINELMISLGSETRLSEYSDERVEEVREELKNYKSFTTANELADSEYNKESLQQDATIKVNLENEVISSPKLIFDLDSLTIGNVDKNETDAIKLRASIPQDLEVIRNIVNSEVGIPEQNRFVQAFDNNDVENSGADIMNRKDVNFIKKVFFDANGNKIGIGGKAVEIIGKDKLLKLRDKLILLDFYEKQIKTIKDKVTQSNLNCK